MKVYLFFILLIFNSSILPRDKELPWSPPDTAENYIPDTLVTENPDTLQSNIAGGITAKGIIDKYVDAIGGKEKLYNVTDRTTIIRGLVQGINIIILSYQKAPDKKKQVMRAGTVEQQIIFDGEKAIMKMGDKTEEITGTELEKLRYESVMVLLPELEHYGILLNLLGIENVEGKESYKVEMVLPSGIKWTHYYDKENFLKVKESKYIKTPSGLFEQETIFGDYREVEGIKYPFVLKQKMGNQTIEFTVTSVKINTGLVDREFNIN